MVRTIKTECNGSALNGKEEKTRQNIKGAECNGCNGLECGWMHRYPCFLVNTLSAFSATFFVFPRPDLMTDLYDNMLDEIWAVDAWMDWWR
jgi:hypothetical protein